MDETWLFDRLLLLIPLALSLSVHEWAHAYAAHRLGDDTARLLGRLTLNPIAHVDPIGTVLLPLLGVPFGWAKPVPINPIRFRGVSMRIGLVWTAAAGPLSNAVLAAASIAALAALAGTGAAGDPAVDLLSTFALLNVILCLFNLLPIPPLDGSRIVDGLLPDRLRGPWEAFERVAPLALAAIIVLPMATGHSPLRAPIDWTLELIDAVSRRR